jgi:hypothetical protein
MRLEDKEDIVFEIAYRLTKVTEKTNKIRKIWISNNY